MASAQAVVVGGGAIGLVLMHLLVGGQSRGETEAVLVARAHTVSALARGPVVLEGAVEGQSQLVARGWQDFPELAPNAAVFVATKCPGLEEQLARLGPHLRPDTAVILCHNGLGIEALAQRALPGRPILRLLCWLGSRRLSSARVRVAGYFKLELAGAPEHGAVVERWASALEQGQDGAGPIPVERSADPKTAEWRKALWNLAVNGLCTLADGPNGEVLDHPQLRAVAEDVLAEAMEIAALEGVALSEADSARVFASLDKTRGNVNATLEDLRAGRAHEMPWLNGAVDAIARRHGRRAPLNGAIARVVDYLHHTQKRTKDKHG